MSLNLDEQFENTLDYNLLDFKNDSTKDLSQKILSISNRVNSNPRYMRACFKQTGDTNCSLAKANGTFMRENRCFQFWLF